MRITILYVFLLVGLLCGCASGPPDARPNTASLNPVYWGYGNYCGKYNPLISAQDEAARLRQYLDFRVHGSPVDDVDWACYVHDVCSEENGGEQGGGLTSQCNMQMWADLYARQISDHSPKHCEAIRTIVGQLFVTSETPGEFWYEAGGATIERASKVVAPFLLLNTYGNLVWDTMIRRDTQIGCDLDSSASNTSKRLSRSHLGFFRSEVRNRSLEDGQWLTFVFMSLRTAQDADLPGLAHVVYPLLAGGVLPQALFTDTLYANPLAFERSRGVQLVPDLDQARMSSVVSFAEANISNASLCVHEMAMIAGYAPVETKIATCNRAAFDAAIRSLAAPAIDACNGFDASFNSHGCGDRYDFYAVWIQALDHIRKSDSQRITNLYANTNDQMSAFQRFIDETNEGFDPNTFQAFKIAEDLRQLGGAQAPAERSY